MRLFQSNIVGRRTSKTGTSIYYFHPDHLGGLNVVTDNDGRNVQSNTYYPFGETRDTTGSDILQYKFTGQENDPESGLYYYGARFYDPVIGRFITPDSIVQSPEDPQSLNRYTYCRNNPVLFTDPTGHFWQIIVGIIIGAALNSSIAAIQGQDVGMAALMGAISGGFFAGAGMVVKAFEMTAITAAGVHAAAGGASGAINAGITGGDVLQSATISAVSAGVAKYAMAGILPEFSVYQDAGEWGQFAMEGTTSVATGTVTGGASAEIIGGDFADGAAQGAWTSAYGFAFNGLISKYGNRAIMLAEQTKAGRWISGLSNRAGNWITSLFSSGGARTEPANLAEQLALEVAKSGPGQRIMQGSINDPRFPENVWAKMQYVHTTPDGQNIAIHYWERISDGFRTGFKFKN